MAQRGKPIDAATISAIKRAVTVGVRHAARVTETARNTVRKYTRPAK